MRDGHGTNIPGIICTFPTGFQRAWQPFWGGGVGYIYIYIAKNLLKFLKC